MKVPGLFLIMAAAILWQPSCLAGEHGLYLISPDHPPVWYNPSGDKLSQYLEWNDAKDQLLLHVAYANVGNTPAVWRDQYLLDTFKLSFPNVHLDRSTNRLYVITDHNRESNLGHLESGVFGPRVVLDNNIEFSAHRRNGVVQGTIKSVSGPSR